MSNPEISVRAYRPSRRVLREVRDDVQREIEKIKRENIIRYAARAANGLPIFEE
jgi:hypothetical protein